MSKEQSVLRNIQMNVQFRIILSSRLLFKNYTLKSIEETRQIWANSLLDTVYLNYIKQLNRVLQSIVSSKTYMYVQLSVRRLVWSPYSAGTRCAYPHTHAHAYTCTCTRRHTLINTHTAHPIPPLRGVLSPELHGVGWPVPFPLRTAYNQVTMKCITCLK
jgi:hypothetical protein